MKVTVMLFGAAKQAVGTNEVDVTLPAAATVEALRETLQQEYATLEGLLDHALFAVNQEYVGEDRELSGSEEIACILPVSGG